jgi:transposase
LQNREKKEKDGQVRQRLQAVRLVWEGEYQTQKIVLIVGLSRNRIPQWVKRFNQDGFEGLQTQQGQGRKPILTEEQILKVHGWIEAGPDPDKDGFPAWNGPRLRERISFARWAHVVGKPGKFRQKLILWS